MKRKRDRLHSRRQRPILSDTLPFEVPASFGNRHLFELLSRYDVRIEGGRLCWEAADDAFDEAAYILSGIDRSILIEKSQQVKFGKLRYCRNISFQFQDTVKTPFQFQICHRENDSRTLSIPHPFSQILVANFYNDHSDSIIYATGRSQFSIRRPSSVARYSNYRDRMHERLLSQQENFEEYGKEYDQIGSFFVYKTVNNVFKFFESYRYHRAEKRFDAMVQIDVSKCFDSIYTHSLPWALHGKKAVKDDLKNSKSTFSAKFDHLMQSINQGETNGIIIGPEFSRIFAEIILQSVDVDVEKWLRINHDLIHKKEYEIFRYVDDYYIFYNNNVDYDLITDAIEHHLSSMKLHINKLKTKIYKKPVITEITIAKSAISILLNKEISSGVDETVSDVLNVDPVCKFTAKSNSRNIIIGYKTILKSSATSYSEVGNFTFALLETAIDKILFDFLRAPSENRSERRLIDVLENIFEFAFFIYAAEPRVNLSVRMTRIVSVVARALRKIRISLELQHHIFKYAHDNIIHQLRKNQSSEFREVESLYLLTALGELGKEYWLDEVSLCAHLRIIKNNKGLLGREMPLNHLTITVTLQYIRSRPKYARLRAFLISQISSILIDRAVYARKDAEGVFLFLDAIACPYIDDQTKLSLANIFGLNPDQYAKLAETSSNWFTTWSGFNLAKELDAKRSRDVY
jgi:hypothetical protein